MSVDDLINSAFENRGGFINGENLFALVANVQTSETFVLGLQEFFLESMMHFKNGEHPGIVLVGAYHTEDAARKGIDSIREVGHHGQGLVAAPGWYALMANLPKNRLYCLSLEDYYVGALAFYQYNFDAGIMMLGICDKKEAAEDMIDYIRAIVKGENDDEIS